MAKKSLSERINEAVGGDEYRVRKSENLKARYDNDPAYNEARRGRHRVRE